MRRWLLQGMVKFLIPILIILLSVPFEGALAKKSQEKRSKPYKVGRLQNNSAVYEAPNFDASVKTFLKRGKKVRYSVKKYKGPGGFGVFYRVQISKGKYGYVVEDDINAPRKSDRTPASSSWFRDSFGKPFGENESWRRPIYLSRYVGFTYSRVNYTEEINRKKIYEEIEFFGLKLSGPAPFFGFPVDLNVMAIFRAPKYYKTFSEKQSGFLLLSDMTLVFPFFERELFLVYYGVGPFLSYSQYEVLLRDPPLVGDSSEVRLGVVFPLGLAVRWKMLLFKLEGKYYLEKERYFGFQGGIQLAY